MTYDPKTLIPEAITEHFGERCDDVEPGCPCCDAWAQYDALTADPRALVAAALERAADIVACQCQCMPVSLDNKIRALIDTDHAAALEAALESVRAEEREAIRKTVHGMATPSTLGVCAKIEAAIRARGESE